jgi:hypothetical protein
MTCGIMWWLDGHRHVFGKLEGQRSFGRRSRKRKKDIKSDLTEIWCEDVVKRGKIILVLD